MTTISFGSRGVSPRFAFAAASFMWCVLSLFASLLAPSLGWVESSEASVWSKSTSTSATSTERMTASESTWNWVPESEHPCNIERITHDGLFEKFGPRGLPSMYHSPIVVVDRDTAYNDDDDEMAVSWNAAFRELTSSPERLCENFEPNFNVTLSSSNSFSERRRTVTLRRYLDEILEAKETFPDKRSNESWYLFGETYTDEWTRLLESYDLPPCQSCYDYEDEEIGSTNKIAYGSEGSSGTEPKNGNNKNNNKTNKRKRVGGSDGVSLAFGVGNRGSGVQWHVHGPGFSEAVQGRKHWVLYPPDNKPSFNKDQSSRQWMEYAYPSASPKPYECTLDPGDMIYFPAHWWHATINLDPYTVFVSSFTTEHVEMELGGYDEL